MPDGYQYTNPRLPRPRTQTHVELINTIRDRDRAKLNDWERNFLESIVRPTARQIAAVKLICGKALVKGSPRRKTGRRRGAGR